MPVFALPFVFFPITRGNRRSGILQPRIGLNSIARDHITGRTFGNLACLVLGVQTELIKAIRQDGGLFQCIECQDRYRQGDRT